MFKIFNQNLQLFIVPNQFSIRNPKTDLVCHCYVQNCQPYIPKFRAKGTRIVHLFQRNKRTVVKARTIVDINISSSNLQTEARKKIQERCASPTIPLPPFSTFSCIYKTKLTILQITLSRRFYVNGWWFYKHSPHCFPILINQIQKQLERGRDRKGGIRYLKPRIYTEARCSFVFFQSALSPLYQGR